MREIIVVVIYFGIYYFGAVFLTDYLGKEADEHFRHSCNQRSAIYPMVDALYPYRNGLTIVIG